MKKKKKQVERKEEFYIPKTIEPVSSPSTIGITQEYARKKLFETKTKEIPKKIKKDKLYSAISKLRVKGIAKSKPFFKKQKLQVKIPIKKGETILGQRSRYFTEEYEKEKSLLAWN